MRHITGRAVRLAVGTTAAIAAVGLPLVSGSVYAAASEPATGASVVQAGEAVGADAEGTEEPVELTLPKPKDPGDGKGSWVWDKEKP
ncbi:hypothetical protein [Streptomyces sp. NPDC013187]|uniref:hypothetical protein n=1 Tax=Streptomyces sp. NPDC013187 TaxID=3364865 RepID=UPI00368ED7C3